MRKFFLILAALLALPLCLHAQFVNSATYCATSNDGTVVGVPNPLATTSVTAAYSGSLPAGVYYVQYTYYATVGETLPSPEQTVQLTGTGEITVAIPASGLPSAATGMNIYIGTASGGETLQGSTVGTASFIQSTALNTTSAQPPATNNTVCLQVANDAVWPVGTGYNVSLTDSSGNSLPGYPMQWQLMGPGTTINLQSGIPYYHGNVIFPSPIMSTPLNHVTQSINGNLNLGMYSLFAANVNITGAQQSRGLINTTIGYQFNGLAAIGTCLVGNGTYFVGSQCIGAAVQKYCTGTVGSSETEYLNTAACSGATSAAVGGKILVPAAGLVGNLQVLSSAGVVGGSGKDVLTVFKNGSSTTVTCTIAASGTTCSDTSHSFSVVGGDVLTFQFVTAPSDTAANVMASVSIY